MKPKEPRPGKAAGGARLSSGGRAAAAGGADRRQESASKTAEGTASSSREQAAAAGGTDRGTESASKAAGGTPAPSRKVAAGAGSASRRPAPRPVAGGLAWWYYAVAAFLLLGAAFELYSPALHGPFLFDDSYLPMNQPNPPESWVAWLAGVRPLLSLSYWFNWQGARGDTYPYHAFNVFLHFLNTLLVFLILRKLTALAQPVAEGGGWWREALAGFGAALFLAHPVQTEAVAYIAGRSESLSALFFLAGYAVFLYRRAPAISWGAAFAVLGLFLAALLTKEHTITLPALLLLTDYFFNPGFSLQGIRANWRLYGMMAVGAAAGAVAVLKLAAGATSAGFAIQGLTWYQYFFTECRAFFVYLRLFAFPTGQNADYVFPISRSLLDNGAVIGLAAGAALLGAAFWFRKSYPLASFGLLAFAVMLAPTSSVLPIKDPLAERRLYLPLLGLLLVALEGLRRVPARRVAGGAMAVILLAAGAAAYARNDVWSGAVSLWEDTVAKSPGNARAQFQLGYAYFQQNQCPQAVAQYEKVARLEKPDYRLLVDWALACDCAGRADLAMQKLEQAAALEPTAHVFANMAMLEAKQGRFEKAGQALDRAEMIDPRFEQTYVYRGNLRLQQGDLPGAASQYRRALGINPRNQAAIDGLTATERRR